MLTPPVNSSDQSSRRAFPVQDYDLGETLTSGQAFRWQERGGWWTGVVGNRLVSLRLEGGQIIAESPGSVPSWGWLEDYFQLRVDLEAVLRTFPDDPPMRDAMAACRGLRLLRQDPWECLASFILSSTKQIVQIRQIISLLCARYGTPLAAFPGQAAWNTFPSPEALANCSDSDLRKCKMGFRAPALLTAARTVASGRLDLAAIGRLPLEEARAQLLHLKGVGRKIADCVLLFAYGFDTAFPVDVWVVKALRGLYFPRRRVALNRLHEFAATHFGPHAGYAQQYLFHYMRTKTPGKLPASMRKN